MGMMAGAERIEYPEPNVVEPVFAMPPPQPQRPRVDRHVFAGQGFVDMMREAMGRV